MPEPPHAVKIAVVPSPATARPYAGLAPDDRRRQRVDRLVAATLDLVGQDGVAGLTVGTVCALAGLSKRYFYEAVATTDDLVALALQRTLTGALASLDETRPGADVEELLRTAVHGVLRTMDDPRAARLYLEAPAVPAAAAVRDATVDAVVDALLRRVVGDQRVADPRARAVGHLLVSGATHTVATWLRGDLDLGRDELVEELVAVGLLGAARLADPS